MMTPLEWIGISFALVYAVAMVLLASQGLHLLWMLWRWRRHRRAALAQEAGENPDQLPADEQLPRVLVQLPVYNERDMVERLVQAVAALDWPRDRLHIQLLDDSTDDSAEIGRAAIEALQGRGLSASWLHRVERVGYKAGALEAGMAADDAPFIAIFDADFVPQPDFLRRAMLPLLQDEGLALVQGRWEHLNASEKTLTRAQAVGIDAHFAIEQSARAWSGLAMNFNGTCGVWRRQAIIEGGGWQHDTLTEDMDLSYRVQLVGWRCTYRVGLAVPGELPRTLPAFMQQQFRWAKGSIQTARKLLPAIWRSSWNLPRKAAATMHLCHYLVHPLMLIAMLAAPPAVWLTPSLPLWMWWAGAAIFLIGAGAPILTYAVGQFALGRGGWRLLIDIPRLAALGTGIAINNTRACLQALRGQASAFERTPKGAAAMGSYRVKRRSGGWEILAGGWAATGILLGAIVDRSWIAPILLIYASGLLSVGIALLWGRLQDWRLGAPEPALGLSHSSATTVNDSSEETAHGTAGALPQLCILARAPQLGVGKRRLAATIGDQATLTVYQALLQRLALALDGWPGSVTLHLDGPVDHLHGTGLEHLPVQAQVAGSLATRMHAALAHALKQGPALIIGTDIPRIEAGHLAAMANLLATNEVTIGPASDGGYWALGLRSSRHLATCCDEDLPWSSPKLLGRTQDQLSAAACQPALGPELSDLDTVDDLQAAQAQGFNPGSAELQLGINLSLAHSAQLS